MMDCEGKRINKGCEEGYQQEKLKEKKKKRWHGKRVKKMG